MEHLEKKLVAPYDCFDYVYETFLGFYLEQGWKVLKKTTEWPTGDNVVCHISLVRDW